VIDTKPDSPLDTREKAQMCIRSIANYKAQDPILLKVEGLCSFADYFVICSGSSSRQVQGIADNTTGELRRQGIRPLGVEGESEGKWILMDYGDVVIHIFYEPVRYLYDLESLWSDAKRMEWEFDSAFPEEH
jgi:ribosome-associated protein